MENSGHQVSPKQAITLALITSITSIVITLIGVETASLNKKTKPNPAIVNCCDELDERLSCYEFSLMDSTLFPINCTKKEVVRTIKWLIEQQELMDEYQSHYLFDVYLIQRLMLERPKRCINTRLQNQDEAYFIMQRLLKSVDMYVGPIDGNRATTNKALTDFQIYLNEISPNYINPSNYGIFGNSTLQAIINQNRQQKPNKS